MTGFIGNITLTLSSGLLILALASCGGSGSGGDSGGTPNPDPNPTPPEDSGLLQPVASEAEFLDSLRSGIEAQTRVLDLASGAPEFDGAPTPLADSFSGGSFSSTYTLEANVGEYDVVKYDGEHLYVARQTGFDCCFFIDQPFLDIAFADVASGIVAPLPEPRSATIRVLSTDTGAATAAQVNEIELPAGQDLLGMFLNGDLLAAVTSEYFFSGYGEIWLDGFSWGGASTGLKIYDISDPLAATLEWDMTVQGGLAQSRRVGDVLYLITRHHIALPEYNYYASSEEDVSTNQAVLAGLTIADVTPQLIINDTTRNLFSAQDCLVDREESNDLGSSVITSITRIPMNNPEELSTLCYPESAYGVYVTEQSIYISDVRYDSTLDNSQTRIHKFDISTADIEYRGSGDVAGALWSSGQRDFRINEYQGRLRLVTSEFTQDAEDRFDHILHILEEAADERALIAVAELPNENRPEEIGKPNEDLYGVRFQGDRAYLVTFERIDPLYVVDLSDASDPQITGELEVTGFSDFLHPVTQDLLLGLGVDGPYAKLELFNVADISAPISLGALALEPESNWSWSAAQYDRHAFTYLADVANPVSTVDRFTVPVQYATESAWENALLEFEISGKDTPDNASLTQVGKITASNNTNHHRGEPRSVLANDAVYFISGSEVWSALWGETGAETGPQ